jgi:hypothetical protein
MLLLTAELDFIIALKYLNNCDKPNNNHMIYKPIILLLYVAQITEIIYNEVVWVKSYDGVCKTTSTFLEIFDVIGDEENVNFCTYVTKSVALVTLFMFSKCKISYRNMPPRYLQSAKR